MTEVTAAERAAIQRRTVATLMTGQVLGGAAMSSAFAVSGLLASDIVDSDRLAGVAAAMVTFGAAVASVPLSRLMRRRGRRPGLRLGYAVGTAGAVLSVVAGQARSMPLLIAGMFLFGWAQSSNLQGRYVAASRDATAAPQYRADHARLLARLQAQPDLYGRVVVTQFNAGQHEIAPPGSADYVLTFRNLHNWVERNEAEGALRAFHRALKPGGILGVVDHRGRTDQTQEAQMKSGYLRQDYAVALIEKAGFRLLGASEANANPQDTKDHPAGVWTLPPAYRLKDVDRDRYRAIGESDRFTLKFEKR